MLDIQTIREQPEKVAEAAKNKGYKVDIKHLLELDKDRKELIKQVEELRQRRNEISAKTKGNKPDQAAIDEGKQIKTKLTDHESSLKKIENEWLELLKSVPNLPTDDVPIGKSEDDNQVAKTVGELPKFDFAPKNHWEIAEMRGWIDKERASKVAGSRFAYIKGDMVKLQLAILQFVINTLTDEKTLKKIIDDNKLKVSSKPFVPVLPPLMLKTDIYDAMDRLEPQEERYKIEGEELWLQGSAEHVLGSMHANEIFEEKELPLRYLGFATSFRKEAGTYGKDMEGIIRMHQFDKLEMESLTTAETSLSEHLLMIAIQEYLMSSLGLPYRLINKCTADIGKPNARGWDVEVWLPGQNKYRETHTADYMTDYQARRLQTRVRRSGEKVELVHTNDATASAMGRTMVAIIENYQQKDGQVKIPKVLQPYMGGRETL
jgi:seryl-tRNA synthetase